MSMVSPDPLTEDESLASTPPRHSRDRHTRSRTPTRKLPPAKKTSHLYVADAISSKRIRVTVETSPDSPNTNYATQRDRPNSSSSGSGVRLSPTPYYSTPFKPRAMKVKTMTVPLRGLSDSEAENDAAFAVATPARGRGRPKKIAATPVPTKGKRIGTPAAKVAKVKGAETPSTKTRRLSDLLHTGGSSGDNSEEWDFNIPQHVTTGRGRSESHARVAPYNGRDEEERASSEVPMSSRANKRGRRIGVESTPSGFGFSYKKPKIGQSRLGRLDFEAQLGRSSMEERRSSESIVEPDQAAGGFETFEDSSRPSTADSLLNGRHVSSSPPNLGGNVGGKGYPTLTPSQRRSDRRQSMGYQEFSFAQYDEDLKSSSIGSMGLEEGAQTAKPPSPPHTESPAHESDDQWIEPPAQAQRRVSPSVPAHREALRSKEGDEPSVTERSPEQQYYDQDALYSSDPSAPAQRPASPPLNRQPTQSPSRYGSPAQQYYDQNSHTSSPAASQESTGAASTAQTSAKPPSPPAQQFDDEEVMEDQDWSLTQSRREIPRSPIQSLAPATTRLSSHSAGRHDREASLRGGAGQPQSSFREEQQYDDQDSHSFSPAPSQSQPRHSSHSRHSVEADVPFPGLSPERLHQQIRSASQSLPQHVPFKDTLPDHNHNQGDEEGNEDQAFNEFDTIMENEDFTMIATETVPSLLQYFTSPFDPAEQAEIRQKIAYEEKDFDEEERQLGQEERELVEAEMELERSKEAPLRGEEISRRRMRASGFQDIVHETIERNVSREVRSRSPPLSQEGGLEPEDAQYWSLTQSRHEILRSPPQIRRAVEEEWNPMLSRNQIPRSPVQAQEDELPARVKEVEQQYYDQDEHSSSPAPPECPDPGNEDDLSHLSPPPLSREIPRSPPQTQEAVDDNGPEQHGEQDLSHLSPPPPSRQIPRSPPQTQEVETEEAQDDEQEEEYEQDWSLTQSRHEIPRSPLQIVEEISFVQRTVRRTVSREPEPVTVEQEDKEQDWSLAQSQHEIPGSPLPAQTQDVPEEVVVEEVLVLKSSALLTPDETPSHSRADIDETIEEEIAKQVKVLVDEEVAEDVDIWTLEASTYNQTRLSVQHSSAPAEAPSEKAADEAVEDVAPRYSWKRASKASAEPEIDVVQGQEQRRSSPVPALKRSLQAQAAPEQLDEKASSPVLAPKRSLQREIETQEQPVEEVKGDGEEDVWMAEASALHPDSSPIAVPEPTIEDLAPPIPNLASPLKPAPRAEPQPQPQTTAAEATASVAAAITEATAPPTPVFKRSLQRSQVEIELEEVLQKARKRRSGLPEDWITQCQGSAFGRNMHTSQSAFDNTMAQDNHDQGNTSFGLTIDGTGEERPSMLGDASILRRETRQREAEQRALQRSQEAERIRELAASKETERQRRREERELERRKKAEELEKELHRERVEREAKREEERRKRREERERARDEELNREREERYKSKLAEAEKAKRSEETQQKAEAEKLEAEAKSQANLLAQLEAEKKAEDRIAQEATLKAQAEAESQAELEAERLILEAKRAAEREEARVAELRKQREAAKQRRREERQAELEGEQSRIAQENQAQRLAEVEAENTRAAEEREAQREAELRQEREAAKQRRREERQAELDAEEKRQTEERHAQKQAGLRKEREAANQRRREERQAGLEAEEQRQAEERDALKKVERRQEMDKENVCLDSGRAAKRARFEPHATHLHRPQARELEIEQPSQNKTERQSIIRIPTSAHPISHKVYDHGQEKMSTSYALSPLKVSRKENNEDEENPFRISGQGKRTFEPREALMDTKQSAAGMPKPDFLFDPPSRFVKEKVKEDFEFNPPAQHPLKEFAVSDSSRARGGKSDLFCRQAAPSSMGKEPEMEEAKQQKLPALRRVMKSADFDPPYSDGLRTTSGSEDEVDEMEAEDENNPFMAAVRSVGGSVERSVSRSASDEESEGESDGGSASRSERGVTPEASRDRTGSHHVTQDPAKYSESEESSEQEESVPDSESSENDEVEVHVDAKMPDAPSLQWQQSRSSQSDSKFESNSDSSDEQDENKPPTVDVHGDDDDDGNEDDDQSMVDVEEDEDEDPFSRFSDSENEIVASTPMPPRGLQAPMRQPLRTVKPQLEPKPESPERPHQRRRPQIEDSEEDSGSDLSQDEEEESQSRSRSESDDELEEKKQRQDRRSTSSLPHVGLRTGNIGAPKSPLKSSLRHPLLLGSPRKNVVFSATTAISPESSFEDSSQVNGGLTAYLDRLAGEDSNSESGFQSLSPSLSFSPSASPTPSVEDQQIEDEQTELDDRSHLRKMTPYDWAKPHWKALLSIKSQFESDSHAVDDIPNWIQNSPYVDETIWGAEEDGSMDLVVEPWMVYVAQLFIESREDEENGSEDWRGEVEEVIKRVYGLVSVERKCAREGKIAPWETRSERVRTFQEVKRRTVERLDKEGRWVEVKPERRGFFGFGTAWL